MCGTNIAKIVDVEAVAKSISVVPGVVLAKTYKYMCSNPGQEMITQDIKEYILTGLLLPPAVPTHAREAFRGSTEGSRTKQYVLELAKSSRTMQWYHKRSLGGNRKGQVRSGFYAAVSGWHFMKNWRAYR